MDDYEGKNDDDDYDDDDEVVHGRLTCRLSLPLLIGNGLLSASFALVSFTAHCYCNGLLELHFCLSHSVSALPSST